MSIINIRKKCLIIILWIDNLTNANSYHKEAIESYKRIEIYNLGEFEVFKPPGLVSAK